MTGVSEVLGAVVGLLIGLNLAGWVSSKQRDPLKPQTLIVTAVLCSAATLVISLVVSTLLNKIGVPR